MIVEFKNREESPCGRKPTLGVEESPAQPNFIHTNLDLDDIPDYEARNVNDTIEGSLEEEEDERRRARKESFMTLQHRNKLLAVDED